MTCASHVQSRLMSRLFATTIHSMAIPFQRTAGRHAESENPTCTAHAHDKFLATLSLQNDVLNI